MEEQLSLFSVISAVPLDEHGRPLEPGRIYEDESAGGQTTPSRSGPRRSPAGPGARPGAPRGRRRARRDAPASPDGPPPPARPGRARRRPRPGKPKSPLARRRELREANSELVRELVHGTGKSHAELNADLNRKAGIRRVSEATIKQLEQRLELARRLLRR